MEVALYEPGAGYYRCEPDRFGKRGDYFTAEQLQPVFGILIANAIRELRNSIGNPERFCVVELGAGRREMAGYLQDFGYAGIDIGDSIACPVTGVVFANEFFDALPVRVAVRRGDRFLEMLVGTKGDSFTFVEGDPVEGELEIYLVRYHPKAEEGATIEVNLKGLEWIRRLASIVECGYALIIDYGFTAREWALRHQHGTLMSYRHHRASDDVLSAPGESDITAHVAWTPLQEAATGSGWKVAEFETLASFLLRAGKADTFESAVGATDEREGMRRRLQLKTLLFGMGETFRVLLLRRGC
jgi:SAM-dependent MidA family methyltransferase